MLYPGILICPFSLRYVCTYIVMHTLYCNQAVEIVLKMITVAGVCMEDSAVVYLTVLSLLTPLAILQ